MDNNLPVDITQFKTPSQLLRHLGTGDWLLAPCEALPDLLITQAWRQHFHDFIGREFAEWVIGGIDRTHHHDYDPVWDRSGNLRSSNVASHILLKRHKTLEQWAKQEHTGQSKASFVSGMGLFRETYAEALRDYVEEQCYVILEAHLRANITLTEEEDEDTPEHPLWDDLMYFKIFLDEALYEEALQGTTETAWAKYEIPVHEAIATRQREAEIRREQQAVMREKVALFWETYLPELLEERIEMPDFKDMNLAAVVADAFADADPAIVAMIIDVEFPGSYSNSVKEAIIRLARAAPIDSGDR